MMEIWPFSSSREKQFDRYIQACAKLNKFSGVVLVAQGDQVVFSQAIGMASYELDVPNVPMTIFQLGSLTKPFTAVALLQLQDAGCLHVKDPLATYMPDFPHASEITLHHLLTNSSGIFDYVLAPEFQQFMGRQTTVSELIASFSDRPLEFTPGDRLSYSNSNWVLLGAIIEQLSGQSYNAFLQKHQFQPLGLTHSGYEEVNSLIKGRASGYFLRDNDIVRSEYDDPTSLYAAGGLHSNVSDVFHWLRALNKGMLLSQQTSKQMLTPNIASKEEDKLTYGYGLVIDSDSMHPSISHSGGMHGYQTLAKYFTEDDLTIVVLNNFENVNVFEVETALAAIAFGEPYTLPEKRSFIELDPALAAVYAGEYKGTFGGRTSTLKFFLEDGKFWMHVPPLPKSEMHAISATTYFTRVKGEVELTFVVNEQGKVNTIDINWSGMPMTATRLE